MHQQNFVSGLPVGNQKLTKQTAVNHRSTIVTQQKHHFPASSNYGNSLIEKEWNEAKIAMIGYLEYNFLDRNIVWGRLAYSSQRFFSRKD